MIRPWSAGPAAGGAIVLPGDQLPVPGQESLRGDDRCHRHQSAVAERLCFDGHSTALVVRKPESTTAELLTQDLVLLAEVVDCLLLLLIHPARDRDQHEPERIENGHPSTVSRVTSATTRRSHCFQCVRVSGQNEIAFCAASVSRFIQDLSVDQASRGHHCHPQPTCSSIHRRLRPRLLPIRSSKTISEASQQNGPQPCFLRNIGPCDRSHCAPTAPLVL